MRADISKLTEGQVALLERDFVFRKIHVKGNRVLADVSVRLPRARELHV